MGYPTFSSKNKGLARFVGDFLKKVEKKEEKIRYCKLCGKETFKYSRAFCEECRMKQFEKKEVK